MTAHQASPSLGFSRKEHWSGLISWKDFSASLGNMYLVWKKKITGRLAVLNFRILTADNLKDLFCTILRTLCILLLFSPVPGITIVISILQRGRLRCIETNVMKYRRRRRCWNITWVIRYRICSLFTTSHNYTALTTP